MVVRKKKRARRLSRDILGYCKMIDRHFIGRFEEVVVFVEAAGY